MAAPVLPTDFYKSSTFFTLSGTAGAVWLFCLVLGNLDPEGAFLTPKYFRFIALALSLILAIAMLLRRKIDKKLEHWLFAFFNGLLIFVNASGLNAISAKLTFENIRSVQEREVYTPDINKSSMVSLLGFSVFKNQVSWWIDDEYYKENKNLKTANQALKQKIDDFEKLPNLKLEINNYKAQVDSLNLKINELIKRDNSNATKNDSLKKVLAILANCQDHVRNLQGLQERGNQVIKDCNKSLSERNSEIKRLNKLIKKYKKTSSGMKFKIADLTKKLSKCNKKLDDYRNGRIIN